MCICDAKQRTALHKNANIHAHTHSHPHTRMHNLWKHTKHLSHLTFSQVYYLFFVISNPAETNHLISFTCIWHNHPFPLWAYLCDQLNKLQTTNLLKTLIVLKKFCVVKPKFDILSKFHQHWNMSKHACPWWAALTVWNAKAHIEHRTKTSTVLSCNNLMQVCFFFKQLRLYNSKTEFNTDLS